MSFSGDIKEELTGKIDGSRHCRVAELASIIEANGIYSVRENGRLFLVLQSENPYVMRKAFALIKKTFHTSPEVSVLGGGSWSSSRVYTLCVRNWERVRNILLETHYLQQNGAIRDLDIPASKQVTLKDCCKRAYVRGAFLSGGSVSDPRKSYHFEINCGSLPKAEHIRNVIGDFGIEAKIIERKRHFVVYVKDGESITDLLNLMGATTALMNMENIRILRDISGNVNRQVNCETANLNKTVNAGLEQTGWIRKIEAGPGLKSLKKGLRDVALARLEYPDMGIEELGRLFTPPLSKSCVYHRLQKIREISESEN